MLRTVLAALFLVTATQAQLSQFRVAPERVFPRTDGRTVTVGDLDGDRYPDLVSVWNDRAELHVNDGTGRFTTTVLSDASSGIWMCAALGDIDGDGDQDLLIGRLFARPLLFVNDGAGTFTVVPFPATASIVSQSIALVDVDGDGDLDAIVGGSPLEVHRNDGRGGFTEDPGATPGMSVTFFEVGDVEPDGDPDLVMLPDRADSNLLVNDGSGRFTTAPARLPRVTSVNSIALGDVNGDGRLDVFFLRRQSAVGSIACLLETG